MSQGPRGKLAAIFRRQKTTSPSPETSQPATPSSKPATFTPSDNDLVAQPLTDLADGGNFAPPPVTNDPLLSLSPDETLNALREADVVPSSVSDQHTDAITKGIRNASATERSLGVRAAIIGSRVRAWVTELGNWRWPGSFASLESDPRHADDGLTMEGSLPPALVAERKARIEAIYDELDTLDIEELKDFVRSAHVLPSSRGSSLYEMDITAPSVVRYLDDFTTLVTGTILMALPYVHRLNRMLNLWSTRLLVLGQVPTFLDLLWSTRTAVDSAWDAIKPDEKTPAVRPELSREAYDTMQAVLGARITQLARTIDSMLDMLEGHQDTLPDPWIDLMEAVQADYEEWVAIAERLAEEHNWQQKAKPRLEEKAQQPKSWKEQSREVSPKASATEIKPDNAISPAELSMSEGYRALEVSLGAAPPLLPSRGPLRDESGQPINEESPSNGDYAAALPAKPARPAANPASYMVNHQDHAPDATTPDVDTPRKQVNPIVVSNKHRKSDELSYGSSPPQSATSSSFASDISEPQIMDASPVQLTSYSPSRPTPQEAELLRRDSEQTDRSFNTVRGSVDFGDSKDSSRTGSSLDQVAVPPETPVQNKVGANLPGTRNIVDNEQVRNILVKRSDSNASSPATAASTPAKSNIPEEPRAEEESEFEDEDSFIQPTREPRTLEEQLSNRIRTILANIPGRIRLSIHAQGSEKTTVGQRVSSTQSRTASGGHKAARTQRSVTPALTLAPAFDKSTPKVHAGNSEIKVYHLQSPDREKPIKLYVRLVGDEERVMVRVGGGWADLGDYLKDYALHHGRRTASDARTEPELSTSSTPPRAGRDENVALNSSPASDSLDLSDSPNSRPLPALANRKVRGPGSSALAAPPQTPESVLQRKTDALTPGLPDGQRAASESTVTAGENHGLGATGGEDNGTVEAGNGSAARDDSSVGLGGFKRTVELSPTKQAWVEGMLNQASQKSSAEKEKSMFSDLGKAGGTRRLFMRGKKDHD
jgi:Growth-Arrest-Specific Protein 2 Domain